MLPSLAERTHPPGLVLARIIGPLPNGDTIGLPGAVANTANTSPRTFLSSVRLNRNFVQLFSVTRLLCGNSFGASPQ